MTRPMESDFLGVPILYGGSGFASGQFQQVETNSGAPASSSSSLPAPSIRAQRLPKQDCESTITTSLLPFISQFCCQHALAVLQLVVVRDFLGYFVIDVKQAFLGYFVIDVKQAFLSYFVIDVVIILFNRRGPVTFSWRNLFCLVKSNFFFLLYFMCIFCLLIFLMHIFFALPPPFLEQPSIR